MLNKCYIYIIKKFNVENLYIDIPNFYLGCKNETKLSYLLLKYLYFNIFNKLLDTSTIRKNKNGKPFFENNNLFFNISHSKNYICCCIWNNNIGIDIEEDRVLKENSLKKFVTEKDEIYIPIKIWNIKEAYSKFLGIGLKLDFSKISIQEIKEKSFLLEKEIKIDEYNIFLALVCNKDILKYKICNITKNEIIDFYNKFFI